MDNNKSCAGGTDESCCNRQSMRIPGAGLSFLVHIAEQPTGRGVFVAEPTKLMLQIEEVIPLCLKIKTQNTILNGRLVACRECIIR